VTVDGLTIGAWAAMAAINALTVANVLLTIAVVAGCILAMLHLADGTRRLPLVAGLAHGLIGIGGFVALLLALRGPPRGAAEGAGAFGALAAGLFLIAILAGLVILFRRRMAGVALAVHAGVAISGFALFVAWSALG
jgi:hypothetical protein